MRTERHRGKNRFFVGALSMACNRDIGYNARPSSRLQKWAWSYKILTPLVTLPNSLRPSQSPNQDILRFY